MDNCFDVIITGDDVINPKPYPEGVIKALSLLDVENNFQTVEFEIEPDSFYSSVNQFVEFIENMIRLSDI